MKRLTRKIRIANAVYVDLLVNCLLVFIHAFGKGLIKYSNKERRRINVHQPTHVSQDKTVIRGLQLKK